MTTMAAKMLLLCFGLVVEMVSSFTGQPVVTRSAPMTTSFSPLQMALRSSGDGSVSRRRFSPLRMALLSNNGKESRRRRLFAALQKRKRTTSVSASSLPLSSYSDTPFHLKVHNFVNACMSKIRNMDEVSMWRVAAATCLSSIALFRPILDAGLVNAWNFLQNSPAVFAQMFRHDHWEWGLAVTAFFVWIHGFWAADRLVHEAGKRGRVHPWRKFRLHDRFEGQKFRREQERRLQRGENVDLDAQPHLVTTPSEWNWRAWVFELPLYVVPLYLWDYFIPRRAAKIAAWSAPTTLQVCRDVTCGLLLYDLFFFCGHFLMHKVPFIYNTVHKKHHTNPECRAAEIVRLSMVEEVLEVGMSIIALNYLGAHPVSRSIYNVIITFLLTELHCGFDFPWTPQNVVPFGLATGSRRHHYHHRIGKHYYQKFFCHVDRLFGFYQKNDGSLNGDSVKKFKDVPSSWAAADK